MKGLKKIFLVAIVLTMVTTLSGCSNFSSVKKAFEKAGWSYVELTEDDKEVASIKAELEEGDITCTLHMFKKTGELQVPNFAFIIEFDSDAELQKAFSEDGSATLKGLITDAQKSDYVNGTCVLIPVGLTLLGEAKETFKNA